MGWLLAGAVFGAVLGLASTGSILVTVFCSMVGAVVTTIAAGAFRWLDARKG